MNFIFFSRLTREKGFNLIVDAFARIIDEQGKIPGNLFIFSEGPQKAMLFKVFKGEPFFEDCSHLTEEEIEEKIINISPPPQVESVEVKYKIYFFGFQPQKLVHSFLAISHFLLVPSRFLETFGLVALESLARGVPVIGFAKGGLVPFILDELTLSFSKNNNENIDALTLKILEVSEKYFPLYNKGKEVRSEVGDGLEVINKTTWKQLSYKAKWIAEKYTRERWMEQVRSFLPNRTKKILLVTDYTTTLGGIETHIQNITILLEQNGYTVQTFGWDVGKGVFSRMYRLIGLVISCYNFVFAGALRLKISEYKPDVIWLHSTSRFLGPLAVREVANSQTFSCVTYHDLGLWVPFPMDTEGEDEVPNNPGFLSFFISNHRRNPIALLAIPFKYLQVFFIRKYLKDIQIHFVPSTFLIPYVENISEIPKDQTVVLEHFR